MTPPRPSPSAVIRGFRAATIAPRRRSGSRLLDQLGDHPIRTVYQPVVVLDTGVTTGYEALARGPAGRALKRPDAATSLMSGIEPEAR
jgi:sensor c-di-GMP phosphodiesterase-like protein